MKKKLLIATHSVFADGIKNAMELVTGEQNSVSTLCAYTNDMTEVETPIKEIIDALEQESLNHTQNDVDWLNTRDPRAFTFIDVAASGKNVGCLIKNQQITAAFNDVLYYGGKAV